MVRHYIRKRPGLGYSKAQLDEAVEMVKSGRLSGYQAAIQFSIPRTTIMSYVNGIRGQKSDTMGRPKALSMEYEKRLADCLHVMEKNGFGLTRIEIFEIVQTFVRENKLVTPFTNEKPGQQWFKSFCNRHSLSIKKPQSVELSRQKATDPFIIHKYFDILFSTILDLGLENKPHRIWNIDETSFVSDPKKAKIVGLRGFASIRTTATSGKDNTTVLFSSNAAGGKGPPFIIYKGKNTWSEWISENAYPGTVYTATENGWIETKAFQEFFSKSFIPTLGSTSEPTLLIYDGHSTHVQPSVLEIAKTHNVTIIKLPPHSSHLLQPLDLAVFKAFKDKWDTVMVKWQRANYGQKLLKKEFAMLIGQVWQSIDTLTITNGFKKGGIYPMDRSVIPDHKFDPVALKRWQSMESNSISLTNNKESTEHQSPTVCTGNETNPPTLASLALNIIMIGLDSKHNSQVVLASPRPNQVSACNCTTITKAKSFEEIILNSVKQHVNNSTVKKKTRIAGGAEIITHEDVINRLKKNEETKQKSSRKRKIKETSCLPKEIITKSAKINILDTVNENQISQDLPVPSTSEYFPMESKIRRSKKITVTDDKYIDSGEIILKNYNRQNNIKINKNTVLNIAKKSQYENIDPKLNRKMRRKANKSKTLKILAIKQEKGLKNKKTIEMYSSSDESNYSVQDSDESNYADLEEFMKSYDDTREKEESLHPPTSCGLTDIKYFTEYAQKYVLNDWVLVQFCTKKSIKHFIGQIISFDEKVPTIKYVRKVRSVKKESIFTYPTNEDICALKHVDDILAVLPAPEISRRGHLIFKIDFNTFNIQ